MINLPYPPSVLNPNVKKHWAVKYKAKKIYKEQCRLLALNKPMRCMRITFHPPDKRKRDIDNVIAAFKAGQDGLSSAWGIDDSEFEVLYPRKFGDVVKGGAVIIEPIKTG